jgi:hypothetical protein
MRLELQSSGQRGVPECDNRVICPILFQSKIEAACWISRGTVRSSGVACLLSLGFRFLVFMKAFILLVFCKISELHSLLRAPVRLNRWFCW